MFRKIFRSFKPQSNLSHVLETIKKKDSIRFVGFDSIEKQQLFFSGSHKVSFAGDNTKCVVEMSSGARFIFSDISEVEQIRELIMKKYQDSL